MSDTIVAISSPPGRSIRGLLRFSGPHTRTILTRLLRLQPDDPRLKGHTLSSARLHRPAIPVLAAFFQAPRSYTGEDAAELQLPGHPALLDRVLHQAIDHGARLAEPGEFTFRAYTAGRLDLTQAEGVAATIAACSDAQLHAAAMLREGKLGRFAADLVDRLGSRLALVEAGIDFVDQEDVVPIPPGELDAALKPLETQLADLLRRARSWGAIEALPRVVLVGPPSSGKSTLFNALLSRDRAVIHAAPGTTRDAIAEPLTLIDDHGRPVEVMLVDIAGLDRADALLDRQAQQAARDAIARADLVLRIQTDRSFAAPTLDIAAKADLHDTGDDLCVSAHTGHNLDKLRSAIVHAVGSRAVSVAADSLALQPRHESALRAALESVREARRLLGPQLAAQAIDHVELIAGRLRAALDDLAGLGGQLTPDDVIGRVFATFCIGK